MDNSHSTSNGTTRHSSSPPPSSQPPATKPGTDLCEDDDDLMDFMASVMDENNSTNTLPSQDVKPAAGRDALFGSGSKRLEKTSPPPVQETISLQEETETVTVKVKQTKSGLYNVQNAIRRYLYHHPP
jgi:hypothetical protein